MVPVAEALPDDVAATVVVDDQLVVEVAVPLLVPLELPDDDPVLVDEALRLTDDVAVLL
ncbi:MAG TPA: hypothetical protein VJ860_22955 [Polyangia bacterium]|nr:hypothetical protein [Polyangia bacterium]